MTNVKKINKNVKYQLIVWPLIVVIMFFSTSPKRLIVLSFIFFIIFWWWLSLVVLTFYKRFKKLRQSKTFYRISSGVIAFCITILIALGTLHQLGPMDVVFCFLFGVICVFYLKRRLVTAG